MLAYRKATLKKCVILSDLCMHFISLIQSFSRVQLFATPWSAASQASLSITNSRSLLKLLSIEFDVCDAIQSSHPLLSPFPPAFNLSQHQGLFKWEFFTSGGQSIGVSSSTSFLQIFKYSGLISFRMDWLDFLVVQGTLKSLL